MSNPLIKPVATQGPDIEAALLDLNNAHARETSFLALSEWRALTAQAYAATCVGTNGALLLAFSEDAAYDGVNFQWFRSRLDRFVYVDRIVVAPSHRGAGVGRALYDDLFRRMRETGHATVACEVNVEPPNPGSDAFHDRLGFHEIGRAELKDRGKTVRYLVKDLS